MCTDSVYRSFAGGDPWVVASGGPSRRASSGASGGVTRSQTTPATKDSGRFCRNCRRGLAVNTKGRLHLRLMCGLIRLPLAGRPGAFDAFDAWTPAVVGSAAASARPRRAGRTRRPGRGRVLEQKVLACSYAGHASDAWMLVSTNRWRRL